MIKSLQIVLVFIATISGAYLAHSEELVVDSDMGKAIFSGLIGNGKPTKATLAQVDRSPGPREQGLEGKKAYKAESTARKIRYLVREGDTLEGIAKRFQLSVQEILDINGLVKNANVIPGQFLVIPLRVKSPKVEVVREGEKGAEGSQRKEAVGEDLVSETDEGEPKTQGRGGETITERKEERGVSRVGPAESPVSPGEEIVNLQTEMDIRDLIQTMSEITGETFILDDSVKGKRVTIITPQGGFKKQNSLKLFETILDLNGFSIVKKDGINEVVQKRDIKTESIPTEVGVSAGESTESFITRLVPLENIQASDVANILKPLISREGDIAVYPELNTLIIVETRANVNRLLDIIENLDLKKEIEFVKIVNTDAADLAAKLVEILGGTGSVSTTRPAAQTSPRERRTAASRARTEQRARGRVSAPPPASSQSNTAGFRVIVDDRTNTLIVIAYPEDLPKIHSIIKKLDVETEEPEEGIYVIRLLNADAEQVVAVIASLIGGGGVSTGSQGLIGARRTGAGTFGGGAFGQTVTGRGAVGQTYAGETGGQRITRGGTTGASTSTISAVGEEGLRVTADTATNSVIIVGSRKEFEVLRRVIEELDVRRRQVYVEAAILEVSLSDITSLGTNLSIGFTFNNGNDLGFGGTILPGVPSLLGLAADPAASLNLANSLSGLFLGVIGEEVDPDGSGPIPPIPSFSALFQALTSLTDVNVLSTPSIITTDNEEAEIVVADVIPFPTGSVVGDAGVTVQTIDRQPVGIRLAITPQISEGDYLNLNIYTEVSAISPSPADLNTAEFGIATNTRTADSSVVVRNGQTIVIGGLVQDRESSIQNKVPLLGNIPILGNLFKFKRYERNKINLMILLTPRIVEDEKDMREILEQRQRRNMLIQQRGFERQEVY